jgi:hypothetical protein
MYKSIVTLTKEFFKKSEVEPQTRYENNKDYSCLVAQRYENSRTIKYYSGATNSFSARGGSAYG